jgi:hypothetical protein
MQALTSVSFAYVVQQDRVLAVVNRGTPDTWSCWLTRRVVLALLEQAAGLLAKTSPLARRASQESRKEVVAFEHQAAMTQTAGSMRAIPADGLHASVTRAELVERLSITNQGENFRVELRGLAGGAAAGVVRRVELQRMLQMLQDEVAKADWTNRPEQAASPIQDPGPKH